MIGTAYAVYGVIAHFVFPGTILWLTKVHYNDSVTSTLVNRKLLCDLCRDRPVRSAVSCHERLHRRRRRSKRVPGA